MPDELLDILFYVASTSYLLPLIFFSYKGRNLFSPLLFYISLNLLSTITSYFFSLYFYNTYPVFHFAVFLTTISLIRYYLSNDQRYRIVYQIGLFIQAILFLYEVFLLYGLWQNNFYSTVFSNVIMTLFSLRGLFVLFKSDNIVEIRFLESKFYIFTSILIFNSSSFFFSLLENQIRSAETSLFYVTVPLFLVLILIHNILLSIGLWKQAKVS